MDGKVALQLYLDNDAHSLLLILIALQGIVVIREDEYTLEVTGILAVKWSEDNNDNDWGEDAQQRFLNARDLAGILFACTWYPAIS